ncbi:MAG: general secretion pathway protein J [Candidatus Azotimanducaceae bacterium]|jgi:general secretion pathway protein J
MRNVRGFTLLEILVAMSIFALIGLGASQMLRTVITAHERTQDAMEDIASFTKAVTIIQRDFNQVINRPVKDNFGERLPSFIANNGDYIVQLSRTGWNNPLGLARSGIQRVAYDITEEGDLKRYFWLVLDRAEDSQIVEQTLLTNIEALRINLQSVEGDSSETWPEDSEFPLPKFAELVIVSESFGEIRQVFTFVESIAPIDSDGNSEGDGTQSGNAENDGSDDNNSGSDQIQRSGTGNDQ